ncbi:MAG: nicotinate (nicotinamide) nucleotide adenylyltransferase [Bacteroidales bacterium]
MIKTGLLFGSFNPIHIGHIAIASYMKEFESMQEIWFIVSPQNPFKQRKNLASPSARLNMVRIATANFDSIIASDIEFDMPLPSYTLDTMKKLGMDFPERVFHIITGTDNLNSIYKWKGGRTLVRECNFMFYPRPNTDNEGLRLFNNARIVDAPVMEISSSFIRKSLHEGKNMRAFVPSGIYEYIIKNRLYQ